MDDVVLVIEEDKGEVRRYGQAFFISERLLAGEEFIEAGDRSVVHGGHGAGAVEDEGDFGGLVVHCRWCWLVGSVVRNQNDTPKTRRMTSTSQSKKTTKQIFCFFGLMKAKKSLAFAEEEKIYGKCNE